MIRFPETVLAEWTAAETAAEAEAKLRKRIEHDTLVENEIEKLRIRHEATAALQQELDAENTPDLEMTTLSEYQANPITASGPVDLIEGVMKEEGLCLVIGPSKSGKSTLALQMLHSLMTGSDWLGQTVKPIMGSVGIMSYDMDGKLMMNWMSNFPGINPAKVSVVNAHKRGNPLAVPALRAKIAESWQSMGVEVILVDTFSASFFGHDQNDAAATMDHYRNLLRFALSEAEAKALIVIVHTTEASPTKIRGSSVHVDVADSIVAVVPDQINEARSVRMLKYREAIGQIPMSPVVLTKPDSVTHLVDLDLQVMSASGMPIPPSLIGSAFPDLPDTEEEPDVESDEEDDDL